MISERSAGFFFQTCPVAALRHLRGAFLCHLEKEQICELLDVIAVVDSIVAKRVAKAPKFLNDVGHS